MVGYLALAIFVIHRNNAIIYNFKLKGRTTRKKSPAKMVIAKLINSERHGLSHAPFHISLLSPIITHNVYSFFLFL